MNAWEALLEAFDDHGLEDSEDRIEDDLTGIIKKMKQEELETGEPASAIHAFELLLQFIKRDNAEKPEIVPAKIHEGPVEDHGLTIKFTKGKDSDGDSILFARLKDGTNQVGLVKALFDERIGTYMVKYAEISDPYRGKRIGTQVYTVMNAEVKKLTGGKGLASDVFRSDDAERLWSKFAQNGMAKQKKHPGYVYQSTNPQRGKNRDFYQMEGRWGSKLSTDAWESAGDLIETPLEDNGIEIKFKEKIGRDDDETIDVKLWSSEAEEVIGGMTVWKDEKNKLWRIESSALDSDFIGKGIGTSMYKAVDDHVKSKYGYRLASDTARSSQADTLWKRLASSGQAKHVSHPTFSAGFYVMQ